jgi:hypothetical protein
MNNVLSLVQAARISAQPGSALYSDHMLAELLALHEEMVAQLRLERFGDAGVSGFLTGMTDQHEKAAAMLRAQLADHGADTATFCQDDHSVKLVSANLAAPGERCDGLWAGGRLFMSAQ